MAFARSISSSADADRSELTGAGAGAVSVGKGEDRIRVVVERGAPGHREQLAPEHVAEPGGVGPDGLLDAQVLIQGVVAAQKRPGPAAALEAQHGAHRLA